MAKENGYALVRLPSGELRNVPLNAKATVGVVCNSDQAKTCASARRAAIATWVSARRSAASS